MRRVLHQNLMLTLILPLFFPTSQAAGSELFNVLVFHSRLAGTSERQKKNADQTAPELTATALVQPKATARRGVMAGEKMPPKLPPVLKIPRRCRRAGSRLDSHGPERPSQSPTAASASERLATTRYG